MKRLILPLLAPILLAGCASTRSPPKPIATPDPYCLQQADRLMWPETARGGQLWPEPAPAHHCPPPVGWRTYSREDFDRSGSLDLEEFLRRDTLLKR